MTVDGNFEDPPDFFFGDNLAKFKKSRDVNLCFCSAMRVTFPWKIPECPDSRQNPQIHLESFFPNRAALLELLLPVAFTACGTGFEPFTGETTVPRNFRHKAK